MSDRRGRLLSRHYALAAVASVLPFLLVVLVLAVFQYTSQRQQLLDELENEAIEHNVLLGGILRNVRHHVDSLASWAGTHLAQSERQPDAPPPTAGRWPAAGARLITTDDADAGTVPSLAVGRDLLPHMRLAHRAMPYLRWSFFVAGDGRSMVLFPVFGETDLARPGNRDGGRDLLQLIDGPGPFADIVGADEPSAGWTAAYLDPAGAGWLVSHLARIPDEPDDHFVGTSVLLDFLTGFLRAFDYPAGRVWLINDADQLLAASDGPVVDGLRLRTIIETVPRPLLATSGGLAPTGGLQPFSGGYAFVQTVSGTPWRLLFVVDRDEVAAVLWPRFIPYGIILLSLIATLLIAHQLRERLIIRPALALVEFIRAESQDRVAVPPDLPPVWRPSVDAIAEAFAAKRASVDQIRDDAERLRALAGAHPVPVAIVPFDDHRLVYANQAFADLFRIAPEDLPGTDVRSLHDDARARPVFLQQLRRSGHIRSFEGEARRGDGTTFPASLTSHLITFDGRDAIVTAVLDLTEQKAAETEIARQREALRQNERRFRTIAEAHPVPMYILRRTDRRILYASQRFADLMGMPLDQVVGAFSLQFYPNPEERELISRALRTEGAVVDAEVEARRADGTSLPVAVTARRIEYEGEEAAVFGIVDLRAQKEVEAEVARQREALHQSEKLNALGSMLASVAHELNNPLSVVVGYATMMRDLALDQTTKDRAVRIHAAAERCARIVRTFLAMARRKPESRDTLRVGELVDAALEIAGYGLRTTDVAVTVDIDADLPAIEGDGDQLTLVIMNLVVNAQHALQTMPPPRRLEILARGVEGGVVIEVQDNGPGIPEAVREEIFEPFFTTKPQGIGTGIGLSVCRNIVTAHDGTVEVLPAEGGGTVFRVFLPLGTPAPLTAAVADSPSATAAPGRILIVEDEEEIADMLREMLERDGHRVVLAGSGRDALDRLGETEVDLIISDLHMPDLDGPELYRSLAERHPALADRMVFMTGDVLAADVNGFLSRNGLPVFDKPIDPYDIRIRVRQLLERRAGAPV